MATHATNQLGFKAHGFKGQGHRGWFQKCIFKLNWMSHW